MPSPKEKSRIEKKRARWKKTLGTTEKSQPELDTGKLSQTIVQPIVKGDECARVNLSFLSQRGTKNQSASVIIEEKRKKSLVEESQNPSEELKTSNKDSLSTATGNSTLHESDDDDIIEIQLDPYSCRRTSVYVRNSKTYENQLSITNSVSETIKQNSTRNSSSTLKRKSSSNSECTVMKKIKRTSEAQPVKSEQDVNPVFTLVNLKPTDLKKCSVCIDRLEDSEDPFVIRWIQKTTNCSVFMSVSDDSSNPNNDISLEEKTPPLKEKFGPEDDAETTDNFAVNFSKMSSILDDNLKLGKFIEGLTSTPTLMHQDNKNSLKPKECLDKQKVLEKLDSHDIANVDKDRTRDETEDAKKEESQDDEDSLEDPNSDEDLYSPSSQESESTEETPDISESDGSDDNYETPLSSDIKESDDTYATPNGSDSDESNDKYETTNDTNDTKINLILSETPSVVLIRLESITKNYNNLLAREMEQMTEDYVKTHMSDNSDYSSSLLNLAVLSEDSSSLGELCIDESNNSELNNYKEDNVDDHGAVGSSVIKEDLQKDCVKMDVHQKDETQQQDNIITKPSVNKEENIPKILEKEPINNSNSQNTFSSDLEYLEHVPNKLTDKSAADNNTDLAKSIEVITLDDSTGAPSDSQNVERSTSSTSVSKYKSPTSKKKDADSDSRKTLVCIFCEEDFKSLSKIKLHMENKHPKMYRNKTMMAKHGYDFDGSNECSICYIKFETKEALFDHLCQHTTTEYQEAYKTNAEAQKAKKGGEWYLNEMINQVPEAAKENEIQDNGQIVITKPRKISSEFKQGETDSVLSPNNPRTTQKPPSADMVFTPANVKVCSCHEYETSLINLLEIHIEILLSCNTCNTHFRRRNCMELHYRSSLSCSNNRTGRSTKVLCSVCRCLFDEVPNLRQHIQTHLTRNADQKFTYICDICQVIFYGNSIQFYNHWSSHIKDSQFICSKFSFPKHSIISADKTDLTKETKLIRHDYFIVAEYICRKCCKPFQSTTDLDNHHFNEKNDCRPDNAVDNQLVIRCNPCWRTFNKKEDYVTHRDLSKHLPYRDPLYHSMRVTPTNQIYVCKVCSNMSNSMDELKKHFLKHNRVREYFQCMICKDSPQKSITEIEDHFKQQHKTHPLQCSVNYLQAKIFCMTCNLGFSSHQEQQEHNNTHTTAKSQDKPSSLHAEIAQSQDKPSSTLTIKANKAKSTKTRNNLSEPEASSLEKVKITGTKNTAGFSLVGKTVKLVAKNAVPKNIKNTKSQKATSGRQVTVEVSTLKNITTPSISGLPKLTTVQNISTSTSNRKTTDPSSSASALTNPVTPTINSQYRIYMLPPLSKIGTSAGESQNVTTAANTISTTVVTSSAAPVASSSKTGPISETSLSAGLIPLSILTERNVKIMSAGTMMELQVADNSTQNQAVPAVSVSLESITIMMETVKTKILNEMKTRMETPVQLGESKVIKCKPREHLMTLLKDARTEIMKQVSISEISGDKKKIDQLIQDQVKPFFHNLEIRICKMINSKFTKNEAKRQEESNETISKNPEVLEDCISGKQNQIEGAVTMQDNRSGEFNDKFVQDNSGSPEERRLIIDESVDTNKIPAVSDQPVQLNILSSLLADKVQNFTNQNQVFDTPSQIAQTPSPVIPSSAPTQQNEAAKTTEQCSIDRLFDEIIQKHMNLGAPPLEEDISKVVSHTIQSSEQPANQDTTKPLLRVKDISELNAKVQNTDKLWVIQPPVEITQMVPNTPKDVQVSLPSSLTNICRDSPISMTMQRNCQSQKAQNRQGSPMVANMQINSPSQMTQNFQGSPMVANMKKNSPNLTTVAQTNSPQAPTNVSLNYLPSNVTMRNSGSYTVNPFQNNYQARIIPATGIPRFQPMFNQQIGPPMQNPSNNYSMMQTNLNPRLLNSMAQQAMQPIPRLLSLQPRPVAQQEIEARMRSNHSISMIRAMNSVLPPGVRPPPPTYNSVRTSSQVKAPCYSQCSSDHAYSRSNADPTSSANHINVNAYSCSNCKNFSSFNLTEVQQHMITQCQFSNFVKGSNNDASRRNTIYECMFCRQYRTEDINQLFQHRHQCLCYTNNSNMPSPDMSEMVYICKYCPIQPPVIFNSIAELNDHLFQCHNIIRR